MKIITGNTGEKHVTSEDDGTLYASIIGKDDYILDMNDNFSHEVIDVNTIRINSGDALLNGRQVRIPRGSYDTVSIDNGQTGYKRIDLIVIRYESNMVIENAKLVVIRGASTTGTPTTPDYQKESILNGALIHDVPLYEVHLNGINLEKVKKVFITRNMSAINMGYKPNLLINGDFQIWQRGNSVDNEDGGMKYGADRWVTYFKGTTSKGEQRGLKVVATGVDYGAIFQNIEVPSHMMNRYIGSTVTLSVRLKTNRVRNASIGFLSNFKNITTSTEWETYTFTTELGSESFVQVENDASTYYLRVVAYRTGEEEKNNIGDTVEIDYAKLEFGTVATPFASRLYAEELAMCQRYYNVAKGSYPFLYGNYPTPNIYYTIVDFEEMRIAPNVVYAWCLYFNQEGSGVSLELGTNLTVSETDVKSVHLKFGNQKAHGTSYGARFLVRLDAEIY